MTQFKVDGPIDFEAARLSGWLDAEFGEAELTFHRISGGQSNPTYFVDHGPQRLVLRKKPQGNILPGAHAIEREYRVLQALSDTQVPVPTAMRLHEDDSLIGTPFYLMARLDGRIFEDAALGDEPASERRGYYLAMAETLAKLHAVVPDEVGLGNYGKPGSYFERQLARWSTQYAKSPAPRHPCARSGHRLAD